jgi:hypothetical protein
LPRDGRIGSENAYANNVSIRLPEDDLNALSLTNPLSGFSQDRATAVVPILELPATRIPRTNYSSSRICIPAPDNSCLRLDGEFGIAYNRHQSADLDHRRRN